MGYFQVYNASEGEDKGVDLQKIQSFVRMLVTEHLSLSALRFRVKITTLMEVTKKFSRPVRGSSVQ